MNVNGLGGKSILGAGGTPLQGGELVVGGYTLVEYSTSLDPFLMLAGFGVGSSQQVGAALRIVTQAFSGNTGGLALQSFSLAAAVPFNAVSISGGLINSSSAGSNVGLTVNTNAQSMGWHCGGGRRDQWQLLVGSGYPTDCLPVDHQHCRYSNLHHSRDKVIDVLAVQSF